MNIKWVTLISLILAFFFLTSACAADNITDVNTVEKDVVNQSPDISDDINVTFDEKMWQGNLSDINVELPGEASGDFSIKINNEVIYNRTITDCSFKVPVKLPKEKFIIIANMYPPMDMKTYKVSAFYNNIDLNITKTLKVMSYPPDYNSIRFPEEILRYKNHQVVLIFPRSACGMVEFYIDDNLINRSRAMPIFQWTKDPFSDLSLGNHTFRVTYLGDDYYRPFNKTFNFTVVDVLISIPKVINISHDDCIAVETLKTSQGTVNVYIDNKLVKSSKTENGEFILSLEEYIKYTNREVKVVYTGEDFSRSKTREVNMTYDFDIWPGTFTYADENTIEVMLPDTLNTNLLEITINSTRYTFSRPQNIENNIAEVDISKLDAGNYTMCVSFKGDDKFYALSKTYNFTVNYNFHIPDEVEYMDSSKVYLKLPDDACGNLIVYVNDKLFKSVKLSNGYAELKIDSLAPGDYRIMLRYSGSDYNVADFNSSIRVVPKISLSYRFTAGEDKYVSVEVPKNCRGYVVFDIDDKKYKVTVKDGVARYSLKNLKAGEHDIYIDYYGEDGFCDLEIWRVVTVYNAKIKLTYAEATFKGINVKLKLLTKDKKPLASKVVVLKFNGGTYKVKTDKKGVLVFKKAMNLKKKKYILKVTYMGTKLVKKLKVKPVAIKTIKTKKKLIVKVFISTKNKPVKIRVASKKFTVVANKKGIAKISFKNTMFKKLRKVTCSATYLKSTVKDSVKIR